MLQGVVVVNNVFVLLWAELDLLLILHTVQFGSEGFCQELCTFRHGIDVCRMVVCRMVVYIGYDA